MCTSENKLLDFSHKVYKNDPLLFKNYVDKKVRVTTVDENVHTGIVYTVDPVSESMVLVNSIPTNKLNLQIIMGHAVRDVIVLPDSNTKIPGLFLPAPTKISQTALTQRKNAVKQLLLDNRFQVKEVNNDFIIEDIVVLKPPYGLEQCECTNSTVLNRIQTILSTIVQ